MGISAREEVLARVRRALADRAGPQEETPIPRDYRTSSELTHEQAVDLFCERVADYRATVDRVPVEQLRAFVSRRLAERGVARIVAPADSRLSLLPSQLEVIVDDGTLTAQDLDAVDAAFTGSALGVAETGTVVLDASIGQGRRLITLVPDYHLCLVETADIVATVPEAIRVLDPTAPLTWISGPSATSDIELDRVEGVHGPRTLDVVVVERS